MSFTPRKYKDIFDEMRAMTQVVTDFEVGSVARTMYESFAYEMALLYEKMNLVYLSAYVDTAQGNQLDQVVAVLGIERSQPDFAEGIVSFLRDGAGQEISIPIGTLVATEENSKGEKKVYQTSKEGILGATQTRVDVQVRGVERGEEFETVAETVIVMPRPVPGIKFVINDAPVRLVGKRRETDDELRERAKNALISSGKATILSVENALLSLSGVRDAKVKENFHRARGRVKISNVPPFIDMIIFKGTILKLVVLGETQKFRTIDPVVYVLTDGLMEFEIKVESVLEGKIGEVFLMTGQSTTFAFEDTDLQAHFVAELLTNIVLEDFGLIEVYVDAPRLEDENPAVITAERSRIETEIERVRAAGIFSILLPAGKVETSAIFMVDLSPSLSLTAEERRDFEESIEDEIVSFMTELRMGKALLYGKLVKAILSMENIENLSDFRGTYAQKILNDYRYFPFEFSDPKKLIAIDEFERIKPRHICVASEIKDLKINIAYESTGLDEFTAADVVLSLQTFFNSKNVGVVVTDSEIKAAIQLHTAVLGVSLDLRPESWCPGPADDPRMLMQEAIGGDMEVIVSYVEKAVIGTVFGYAHRLEITGAIKLIMPLNVPVSDQIIAKQKVLEAVTVLMDQLGPEEDITFEAMVTAAQSVSQVLKASIDAKDFQALISTVVQPALVDNQKIDVLPLHRAFPQYFCISSNIEQVEISIQKIYLDMALSALPTEKLAVKTAVVAAWDGYASNLAIGEKIVFGSIKSALENLTVSLPYDIHTLSVQALSAADGRWQTATIAAPTDIHIRSIELPVIVKITVPNVIVVDKVLVTIQAISITMAIGTSLATQNTVKQSIANAWAAALTTVDVSSDVVFATVKSALENLVLGSSYTITTLDIRSTAAVDNLIQNATIASPLTLNIRATELASVVSILPADINLTLI